MKIKRSKFYKKLYVSEGRINNKNMKNFLLCGDINWNYYFEKKIENSKLIESVSLIEFYNEVDLKKHLSSLDKYDLQDFCIEEDYFAVLEIK